MPRLKSAPTISTGNVNVDTLCFERLVHAA